MITAAFLILMLSTTLLAGSEFSIAALIHPALSALEPRQGLPGIQALAKRFGQVMPFWMGGTLLGHGVMAFVCWEDNQHFPWKLLIATGLWLVVIVYSLLGPVPINNRVIAWDLEHLPENWREERRRWDRLNWVRVVIIALTLLLLLGAFEDYLILS